jgi:hypothetical protein
VAEGGSVSACAAFCAAGKFVVVLDDEDRENEGDLIINADKVTTEAMAFMVEHTSGVVSRIAQIGLLCTFSQPFGALMSAHGHWIRIGAQRSSAQQCPMLPVAACAAAASGSWGRS